MTRVDHRHLRGGGRLARVLVTAGITGLLAAGCTGAAPPPAQQVRALDRTLTQVDRAIVDQRFGQARQDLERLVQITVAARRSGELDRAQAQPILAAAASLRSALPRPARREPAPEPQPEPQPAPDDDPAPQPAPEDGPALTEEEREKRQEAREKRLEKLEKKREQLQKQREEAREKGNNGGEGGSEGEGGDEGDSGSGSSGEGGD